MKPMCFYVLVSTYMQGCIWCVKGVVLCIEYVWLGAAHGQTRYVPVGCGDMNVRFDVAKRACKSRAESACVGCGGGTPREAPFVIVVPIAECGHACVPVTLGCSRGSLV